MPADIHGTPRGANFLWAIRRGRQSRPDDTAITAKVKAAILAEPGLKSLQINVDTKDATVTLTGNVDSDMLRDRAKQIAMATEGVKNVVDNLSVKTG